MTTESPEAPTVVGFGAVSLDEILLVEQPLSAGKGRVAHRQRSLGGNVAIALATAASLGAVSRFIGYLPDPVVSPDLLDELHRCGVDVTSARVVDGTEPIRSTVIVAPDGERFIAFDDGTTVGAPADLDLDLIRAADVLVVDGYGSEAGLRAVVAARAAGIPVIADLEQPEAPGVQRLMREVDHLIVPVSFARAVTGRAEPAEMLDALWHDGRHSVVVTVGAEGSWFRTASARLCHVEALRVDVVDTTGCGDVFHGAYAWAIATGVPIVDAVTIANAAAAICATALGGAGRLAVDADIHALLDVGTPGPFLQEVDE